MSQEAQPSAFQGQEGKIDLSGPHYYQDLRDLWNRSLAITNRPDIPKF